MLLIAYRPFDKPSPYAETGACSFMRRIAKVTLATTCTRMSSEAGSRFFAVMTLKGTSSVVTSPNLQRMSRS